jgi:RHS repeat-associated protein
VAHPLRLVYKECGFRVNFIPHVTQLANKPFRWQQNGPCQFSANFTGNNPASPRNNNRMDGYSVACPERSRRNTPGNLLSDGYSAYTYDAENRIVKVVNVNGTATYVYDANGHRVERTGFTHDTCDASGKRDYFYDLAGRAIMEVNSTDTACNYELYAGDRHLASEGGGVTYNHSDWLGNVRSRITYAYASSRGLDVHCTNLPFGDALSCTSFYGSPYHFTDKERDFESGLDYFGARYNASSMGRFMTPDEPFVDQHTGNPQSWNLYAYARNNPVTFTDLDGQTCTKDKDGNFSGDTCGQNTETGNKPDQVQVKGKPGSWPSALAWNFFFGLSNAANDFFRPVSNAMGIEPSYMQNVPTGSGPAAGIGAGTAFAATFFIGPEAEGINITVEGLAHVAEGHMVGGAKAILGKKSIFNASEDVRGLIKAAEGTAPVRQATGNFERVVDAGRQIGIDRTTGTPTSTYTVITEPNGNLVTAFPGKP